MDAAFTTAHGAHLIAFTYRHIKQLYVWQSESVLLTPQISRLKRIKEMSYNVRPLLLPLHFGLKVSMSNRAAFRHCCQNDNSVLRAADQHLGLLQYNVGSDSLGLLL